MSIEMPNSEKLGLDKKSKRQKREGSFKEFDAEMEEKKFGPSGMNIAARHYVEKLMRKKEEKIIQEIESSPKKAGLARRAETEWKNFMDSDPERSKRCHELLGLIQEDEEKFFDIINEKMERGKGELLDYGELRAVVDNCDSNNLRSTVFEAIFHNYWEYMPSQEHQYFASGEFRKLDSEKAPEEQGVYMSDCSIIGKAIENLNPENPEDKEFLRKTALVAVPKIHNAMGAQIAAVRLLSREKDLDILKQIIDEPKSHDFFSKDLAVSKLDPEKDRNFVLSTLRNNPDWGARYEAITKMTFLEDIGILKEVKEKELEKKEPSKKMIEKINSQIDLIKASVNSEQQQK